MRFESILVMASAALAVATASATLTPRQRELLGHSLIHRGDGKGRPDNTMEALLYTWGRGYTPESDIRFSKDGVVLAFHDGKYGGKAVGESAWDEIRKWDVGSYRGKQYDTCRAPTWDSIFMAMKGRPERRIHIDYKDVPPEKVAEMVKSYGLERQCYFISRDHALLKRYKAALSNGLTLQWMNLGNWGRIDFGNPEEIEMRERYMMGIFEKSAAEGFRDIDIVQLHCQVRKTAEGYSFCPRQEALRDCIERLKRFDVEPTIFVWHEEADDPEVYKRLFKMGFTSFGTDYPEALYNAITELERTSEVIEGSYDGGLCLDDKGVHINAHGGGVMWHEGRYYWYGEHKGPGRAGNRAHGTAVHCYSSTNLTEWIDEGAALMTEKGEGHDLEEGCVIERPKVVYCPNTGKFVMYFHLELKTDSVDPGYRYGSARVGIAVNDRPTGVFTYLKSRRPNAGVWPQGIDTNALTCAATAEWE